MIRIIVLPALCVKSWFFFFFHIWYKGGAYTKELKSLMRAFRSSISLCVCATGQALVTLATSNLPVMTSACPCLVTDDDDDHDYYLLCWGILKVRIYVEERMLYISWLAGNCWLLEWSSIQDDTDNPFQEVSKLKSRGALGRPAMVWWWWCCRMMIDDAAGCRKFCFKKEIGKVSGRGIYGACLGFTSAGMVS